METEEWSAVGRDGSALGTDCSLYSVYSVYSLYSVVIMGPTPPEWPGGNYCRMLQGWILRWT